MSPLTIRISLSILVNFLIIFIFTLINNMVNGEEYVESVNLVEEEYKAGAAAAGGVGGKQDAKFNLGIELMAGTLAGVSSCILFYPLECIEAKLQVQSTPIAGTAATTAAASNLFSNSKKSGFVVGSHHHGHATAIGPISMAKNILRTEGVKGFYQGITPTVMGNAVNWGIYFSLYRATNHWWNHSIDQYGKTYQGPSWVGNSISAITAGVITTAVVNPFWVLKIRLATTKKYSGITHAFKSILKSEGIGGFWKGVGISFFGVSEGLFQFVSYEYILDQIKMASLVNGGDGSLSVGNYLFAGGTARLIAGCITYPYLLIRSTLQSETCPYKSMTDTVKGIYRNDGIKGLYKGIGPNLARSVPPAAFMFYIVEFFRDILASKF